MKALGPWLFSITGVALLSGSTGSSETVVGLKTICEHRRHRDLPSVNASAVSSGRQCHRYDEDLRFLSASQKNQELNEETNVEGQVNKDIL